MLSGAVLSIMGGKLSFQKDLALPFLEDVVAGLAEEGLPNEPDLISAQFGDVPEYPVDERVISAFGVDDLLVGIGIYLSFKVADKGAQEALDSLYERRVRPALQRMWTKVQHSRLPPVRTRLVFDHWFEGSGVLVRTVVLTDPTEDTPDVTALVQQSLGLATIFLTEHPLTHRVLTYEAVGGRLANEPALTEPI